MIIAVDGPAGAGKSTVSKLLANELGFLYIDTGAMYRALTLKAIETEIDIKDIPALITMTHSTHIDLLNEENGTLRVLLDMRDVTELIRQPRITRLVSHIAKIKEIRQAMLGLQRNLGRERNSVLDGRDIGTVVFPDAAKKFYVDAAIKERVVRRYKELKSLGQGITLEEVQKDVSDRDTIDSTRDFAPLKKADDAIYIDTTNMTIKEVVEKMLCHIR